MEANERFDRTIRGGIRWERLTRQRMEHELCLEQYGYKNIRRMTRMEAMKTGVVLGLRFI